MFFRCQACHAKSIFFPTLFLHVWGAKEHARCNRFECTRCHRLLGSFYSPVPFFLLGALAQLFVLQSGGVRDLWIGGLLAAFAFTALIYRVGRSNGRLRVALDVALLASVLLQVGAW